VNSVPLGRIGGADGGELVARQEGAAGPAAQAMSAMAPSPERSDELGTRKVVLIGTVIILIFFGLFGGWVVFAPLDSAAIASGTVSVENNRKTVQHLEGGIVKQILVRDGDRVKAGQTLIRMEDVQPLAQLQLIRGQRNALLALAARLRAEQDGNTELTFPDELNAQSDDSRVQESIIGQLNIFEARRNAIEGQRQILEHRVAQFREEIIGLQAQIRSANQQLELIEDELKDLKFLFDKRLTPKSRLLALQRRRTEIQGERGQNLAAIARAKQNIAEVEISIFQLRTEQVSEVVSEYREVETELLGLQERLEAAEDVQRRTYVNSPTDGVVVDMQIHSTGTVIQPGERLLDVVPGNEKLVIKARVKPTDIDIVHAGLPAQVRLVVLNQRVTLTVEGTVSWVSADRLMDERSGEYFFTARIDLDDSNDPHLKGLTLLPGMPVEVLIRTGERTLLQYLVSPIRESLMRSLREQ